MELTTLGSWRSVAERIARFTRERLSGDARQITLTLFRTERTDLLDALTSKDFYQALGAVNEYRNRWTGHGGVENDRDLKERLALLEVELARFRTVFASAFDDVVLLLPRQTDWVRGVFEYRAYQLKGSNSIFQEVEAKLTTPIERDSLALWDTRQMTALPLLPFIRIREAPRSQTKACYFYNRKAGSTVRWVSYHFDAEGTFDEADPEMLAVIKELMPAN